MHVRLIIALFLFTAKAVAQNYVSEKSNVKIKATALVTQKAFFFPMKDVQLKDKLFAKSKQLNENYLLSLKPDRFLHRFHLNAGLPVKDSIYGGWESRDVSGFNLGHYLSACAFMYANAGDIAFKQRVDYIVSELKRCQDKRGTGYVGAIPNEDSVFAKLKRGVVETSGADLNGVWVPWYVVHKIMAGLADAYVYTNTQQALDVLVKLGKWTGDVVKNLSKEQLQKMLQIEFGGMPDVLVHLYELTGDRKYLLTAEKFYDHSLMDVLAAQQNELYNRHANTQFPKILAVSRLYNYTGDKTDSTIVHFFWSEVVHKHSYVIGGNSNHEMFSKPNQLSNQLSEKTTETCNTYNMLKLTKQLYARNPHARYFDFYERALYNHILASHNDSSGMFCYYAPLKSGTKKIFSTPTNDFWCCVGTGMESHSKHAEQIYAEGSDGSLYVNLFVASELNWRSRNLKIEQITNYPEGEKVIIKIKGNGKFVMNIRIPWWVNQKASVSINGVKQKMKLTPSSFLPLNRIWKVNDEVELNLPMEVHYETMPDNGNMLAMMYGPLVLAGKLSGEEIPALVSEQKYADQWLVKQNDLNFNTKVSSTGPLQLIPYYKIRDDKQQVYFGYYTPADWQQHQAAIESEQKRQKDIEAATVDYIRIGEQQPEADHTMKGERTFSGMNYERRWRDARQGGWFSYEMKLKEGVTNYILQCTYWGGDGNGREFEILVDDVVITTVVLNYDKPNAFFDMFYAIDKKLLEGKTKITIRFQAKEKKTAGGLYGIRLYMTHQTQNN